MGASRLLLQVGAAVVVLAGASQLVPDRDRPRAAVASLPVAPPARVAFPASAASPAGDGQRPIASLLNVTRPMVYGDYLWEEAGVPSGAPWVRIDLARQTLSVFRGGNEIGTTVILYGADDYPTPTGEFTVREKRRDYRSISYDAPMPFMLRLTDDGVAIHGSDVRAGAATHGCIGVPKAFAERLFAAVPAGTPVTILPAHGAVAGPARLPTS